MKRRMMCLLIVLVLPVGSPRRLMAETPSAERFLERVAAHAHGEEVEREQSSKIYEALNTASSAEAKRALPVVLRYTRVGNEVKARGYAVLFLTAIAIRRDGAQLLSSSSEEISSLIVDADPAVQKGAVAVMDYVAFRPPTNKQPYVAALEAAIQKNKTPQDVAIGMVGPLLSLRAVDPNAVKPVLDFMHRDDLTADTRRELVHSLAAVGGLPEEVNQLLVKELDDPDATVRAAAVVAFADSTSSFHILSRERVERMTNDPREHSEVRELAKEAMAGKTGLSPNIDVPTDKPKAQ
jgi:hypothetical protein